MHAARAALYRLPLPSLVLATSVACAGSSAAPEPLPASEPDPEAAVEQRELEAIERAVLDYAESYYEAVPAYVERGIHEDLVKAGYLLDDDGEPYVRPMDYAGFEAMIQWVVDQDQPPEPGPKEVVILDAEDQTALCQLTGSWGIDYMQLAKFDGRWQTRHVVWQREPEPMDERDREADLEGIEAAVEDYVEGIYGVEPSRIERSVHPELTKYGFWRPTPDDPYRGTEMDYGRLYALAGEWNADGSSAGPDSPREIEVLAQMDRIACAKLTAEWGIDYFHLAKEQGRWRIVQVMWQSID